jgi:hypothetical protein
MQDIVIFFRLKMNVSEGFLSGCFFGSRWSFELHPIQA